MTLCPQANKTTPRKFTLLRPDCMTYKSIKCGGDVAKVMHGGDCIWTQSPIQLDPKVGRGDRSNRIQVEIAVPTNKKGYTEITLNYDWLYGAGCSDIEFTLSDYRLFGWRPDSADAPSKYGTDDGVSGSPVSKVKIKSQSGPIRKISIKCIFRRSVTDDDLKNISVRADYVIT